MYHYSHAFYRTSFGEALWRSPEEIREEIELLRELLRRAQDNMTAAERAKEELLLVISEHENPTEEQIERLEAVVECCEETKDLLEELWQRADTLSEELSDTLFWLKGDIA